MRCRVHRIAALAILAACGGSRPPQTTPTIIDVRQGTPITSPAPSRPVRSDRAEFLVRLVDDETDVFGRSANQAPEGIELHEEGVGPLGPERVRRRYPVVRPRGSESLEAAIARGEAWASTLRLPPTASVVWGPEEGIDESSGERVLTHARAYVVIGDPLLTTADISTAEADVDEHSREPVVRITLSTPAAFRWQRVTTDNVNRRLAILLDGRVWVAPLVRSPIVGGRMSLFPGAAWSEDVRKLARRLQSN